MGPFSDLSAEGFRGITVALVQGVGEKYRFFSDIFLRKK